MPRSHQTYDHRLRDLVRRTRDVSTATSLGVARSTASGWLREASPATVTADALSMDEQDLQVEILCLRRRVQKLRAVLRILIAVLRALNVDLGHRRLPDGASKSIVIRAVERARSVLKLKTAPDIVGLSQARFHAWQRAKRACDLDDHGSRVVQTVELAVPPEVAPPIPYALSAKKTLPIQVRFLVLALAGWLTRQQLDAVDYLREENRILRSCPACDGPDDLKAA